jgi:hypothetical protein
MVILFQSSAIQRKNPPKRPVTHPLKLGGERKGDLETKPAVVPTFMYTIRVRVRVKQKYLLASQAIGNLIDLTSKRIRFFNSF